MTQVTRENNCKEGWQLGYFTSTAKLGKKFFTSDGDPPRPSSCLTSFPPPSCFLGIISTHDIRRSKSH